MPVKKIHYCWFGRNPKPEMVERCIATWKRLCTDYEIIEWNEENFDVNCCLYVQQAYDAKKWAFVSDYCRFWVLERYGGIYLDTDVELLKSLEGLPDTFIGFENKTSCASGLIRGALPGDEICQQMLRSYENDRFVLKNGRLNTKTVCARETEFLKQQGLVPDGTLQQVEQTWVYPPEYFSPKDYLTGELKITDNTVSIHHYDASWYSEEDKLALRLREKYRKFMPPKLALRLGKFVAVLKSRGLLAAAKELLHFVTRK